MIENPQPIIFLYLTLAFTLMLTVFNHKHFLKKNNDFRAFMLYFGCFFISFLIVPLLIILISEVDFLGYLQGIGFSPGKTVKGIIITAIAIPVTLLAAHIGSKDPEMKKQYPFSKTACTKLSKFIIYESAYLLLYYFSWEFLFRGILFFPLVTSTNLITALSIQTTISTLYHIGHPISEIFGALFAGLIFGAIAYVTGSFFYTVFIHALIGISNDTFLYLRYHRNKGENR